MAKIDSDAIVEFFRCIYDGELHDIKPTHSTFRTLTRSEGCSSGVDER